MDNTEWVKVTKDEFDRFIKAQPHISADKVNICEPPMTNIWNRPNAGEDWSVGQGAVARIIHNWSAGKSLGNGISECVETPEYYLAYNPHQPDLASPP